MVPVPIKVVPSAVNTLLPAFLQFLEAVGECLFRNGCELHRRSRLNSLDILMIQDSSSAMILLTNVESFCASCNKSTHNEARTSFWSWVNACGTSLALSFFYPSPPAVFGGRSTYWYSGHQLTCALQQYGLPVPCLWCEPQCLCSGNSKAGLILCHPPPTPCPAYLAFISHFLHFIIFFAIFA
jgi:hypothetical protein